MSTNSSQQYFIEERVRALALVYLTRRGDLIVQRETEDIGVDYWVTLAPAGKGGPRKFGVELRGVFSATTGETAKGQLRPSMHQMLSYGPFSLPIVLFFFTMQNNEGWYTWAAEPIVTPEGAFELVQHDEASCRPLDSGAIDEIVESVDRWYDAFFARASREMHVKEKR